MQPKKKPFTNQNLKFLPLLSGLLLVLTLTLSACSTQINLDGPNSAPNLPANSPPANNPNPAPSGHTKAGPANLYPDPNLTPGDVFPGVTAKEVCVSGYTKTVRDVSTAEKQEVLNRYHLAYEAGKYEVDHFIPLELGGSNDLKNLWPEPYSPLPGARQKDKVENALHQAVCDGKMSLPQAQQIIRQDWYAYYLQHESSANS
ncbi:MAG TPA: HNH endonuclease signature motif containing protein [Chloroflexia bacterium]|nr:HNH endonuclease signature motif containing protein [Chloroflexia bacterium]